MTYRSNFLLTLSRVDCESSSVETGAPAVDVVPHDNTDIPNSSHSTFGDLRRHPHHTITDATWTSGSLATRALALLQPGLVSPSTGWPKGSLQPVDFRSGGAPLSVGR